MKKKAVARKVVRKKKPVVRAKKKKKKRAPARLPRAPQTIEKLVATLEQWQKDVVNAVRGVVRSLGADEGVKWAQAVFELNGPFAFVRPAKKHVTFGFWRGAELRDPYGKLEGDGSRMKHVKLRTVNDVVLPSIIDYVQQAIRLNREKGDPTKK